MSELIREVRYGVRLLWKSRGFTSVSLLALALGIGATTAIFSLLYSILLAPLPYNHGDELVMVWSHQKGERIETSPQDLLDWQKQATVFRSLDGWTGWGFTLATPEWTEQVRGGRVAPGFFDALVGEKTTLGRHFLPEETQVGSEHVVILNNRFWRTKFGSDPNIVGKVLRMSGEPFTVVGVAAPGPEDNGEVDLNVPLALRPEEINRETRFLLVLGRLKPGVTLADANSEMSLIAQRLAQSSPKTNDGITVRVEPLKNDFLPRATRTGLWLMMGAVGFVLLIACVNIANLLLAWGTARQKEIAVRIAQGATGGRVFRQFLIESLALSLIGGVLGIVLSVAILRGVLSAMPRNQMGIPYEADPHLNLPVLFFTLGVSVLAGIFFGCAPAWHASRQNVSDMLKEGGRSSAGRHHLRLRSLLVIAEFALALILVAGAGLIVRSFVNASHTDLGIRTDHVLTFRVPLQNEQRINADQVRSMYAQLLERIAVVPGISAVAAAPGLPAAGSGQLHFTIVGQPHEEQVSKQPLTIFMPVTPDYYRTYGIRLTRGRYLNAQDRVGGSRVAMVSEGFVKKYLAGLEPIGQRLMIPELRPGEPQPLGAPIEWQIVGVFHDVQYDSHPKAESTEVEVPFDQSPWAYTTFAVRTSGNPEAVTKSVAAAVRSVNPDYPLTQVRTMEQVVSESLTIDRFAVMVFTSFAGLALVLAAVGIYGVMTFSVAQRNHEMGIRMALGAETGHVLKHVVGEGMKAALLGMAVGLPGAYFVGRIMRNQLYNVAAVDGFALVGVSLILLLSALLACYWPARRATKIDPLVALREE
ncbi:MAG TPA: ABC transporter permease [Candidatus Saccharimonadales bacterium]|nr:ABC transporter permease [Candidatus Saccharimonadales bacterium]